VRTGPGGGEAARAGGERAGSAAPAADPARLGRVDQPEPVVPERLV